MEIEIIGIGAVGVVTAVGLAELGHTVNAVDIDKNKLKQIEKGFSPINEPKLGNLLKKNVRDRKIVVSEKMTDIPVKIVCVATPSNQDGSTNTIYIEQVINELDELLESSETNFQLIIRSTISANLIESLLDNLSDKFKEKVKLYLNPEFLREGTAVDDFFDPPFIIVGSLTKDVSLIEEIYLGIDSEIFSVDPVSASMIKYACNAFHALKITFANEIGSISESLGGNPIEIMSIFVKDKQLNISEKYLRPGFAYGGSCLNKDLKALKTISNQVEKTTELLTSINKSNKMRIQESIQKILPLSGENILILGLSFKPGTNDLRDSPYLAVANSLHKKGKKITVIDPDLKDNDIKINQENFKFIDLNEISIESFDSVIYFKDLLDNKIINEILKKNKVMFDPEMLLYSKGIVNDQIRLLI